jgi:hypothetical protein
VDATFGGYIEAQRSNLDSALRFELFAATLPRMHRLYLVSIDATPSNKPILFRQFLLVCHKSFLAAATLIGQAQPDDAGPITRRAIEVVRLAAAMKADPAIAEKWHAYEKRMERWRARREGEKPKRLDVRIPDDHPLVQELMGIWGIISDTDVHFTLEHFISLRWEQSDGTMILRYFTGDQRIIESTIINLLGSYIGWIAVVVL